jgi:hypothetical protein
MFASRLASIAVLAAVAAVGVAGAAPGAATALPRPTGLKAFLLKPSEAPARVFPRTPSFAWNPVKGAARYEFQLATTGAFTDGSVVWSNVDPRTELAPGVEPEADSTAAPATNQNLPPQLKQLRAPEIALDVALPWITGEPFSLYARVRAVLHQGATRWSSPFGFNVRWPSAPSPLPTVPGLLRWSPVDGATGYEVWIYGAKRTFFTTSNVADLRELYTFHQSPAWTGTVHWRIRAQRAVYGQAANGLPAVSYGPWSGVLTDANPAFVAGGPLTLTTVLSDVQSTPGNARLHLLTPAFAWSGTVGSASGIGISAELYRVYVATDRDCVNVVFRGPVVGSPAYAPRIGGQLAMPHADTALAYARANVLDAGAEGEALMLDGGTPSPNEQAASASPESRVKLDLWDNGWPNGGYYWTVVPVIMQPIESSSGAASTSFRYRDVELPQDACRSGRVMRFGKTSAAVVTAGKAPFASGMSTRGLLASASRRVPTFYGTPLVAWEPALGAEEYEVQWSKSGYPWKRAGSLKTGATSAVLPLTPGTWFYRVRGINQDAMSKPEMAWSMPSAIRIARPVFAVAGR